MRGSSSSEDEDDEGIDDVSPALFDDDLSLPLEYGKVSPTEPRPSFELLSDCAVVSSGRERSGVTQGSPADHASGVQYRSPVLLRSAHTRETCRSR